MNNRNRLRELGYSASTVGHIVCHNVCRPCERTAYIEIRLEHDSRACRELVEKLISACDSPRALIGRARNSSAMLLFKTAVDRELVLSNDRSGVGVFELISRDGERFTIRVSGDDAVLDVNAWNWSKGKSPLEVSHGDLATIYADIVETVVAEAFRLGAQVAPSEDDIAAEQDRAARLARIKSDPAAAQREIEERQAADDEALVKANPDATWADGNAGMLVMQARGRIAARRARAAAAG